MATKIVTVVGASGYLGLKIVEALLAQGARVKALVRATSKRGELESLGVKDFLVGDLMDPGSLSAALAQGPKADALVACAAGYTGHTKGDDDETDTVGYRYLVDAAKASGLPRFVLVSILECDKAAAVPHFYHKYLIEKYLKEKGQPFIALRPGAFLDQARDMVLPRLQKGRYPELFPGVSLGMVYTPDLARYAALAAVSSPESALGRSVDIGWASPASGELLAQAFSKVLGRSISAEPALPPFVSRFLLPFLGLFQKGPREMEAMMRWIGQGVYVSRDTQAQKELFGELPTVEEAVARYCRDRDLLPRAG